MSTNLHIKSMAIDLNARQFFNKISSLPWAMLLDSGTSGHIDSQFDIMVSHPVVTLTTIGDKTIIEQPGSGNKQTSFDDPLALVEQSLNAHIDCTIPCDLPFSGGALGYFSYDLGRRFEPLAQQAVQDIPLPEMAIGIYRHAIIFDRHQQQVWLVSRSTKAQHLAYLALVNSMNSPSDTPFKLTSPWQHQIKKSDYRKQFNQIQQYLLSGDCYQINYTQRFEAPYQGNEYQAYLELCHHNEMPFSAFLRLDQGTIISVSPERFIRSIDGNIDAKPIKGTRPRGDTQSADQQLGEELLNSSKDRAENLMIVDLLRNDIGRCAAPGSVTVPKLFDLESFPGVHHLVSTVEAKLAGDKTLFDLLRGAFPGGSITGAPKIRAMNIIDQLEPQRRSIYCGSIGYISADNKMDTSITIRTLLGLDNKIFCWAGGGIVADSVCEEEYQECFDKLAKILPVLTNM